MKKIIEWLTLKRLLVINEVGFLLSIILYFNIPYLYICKLNNLFGNCGEYFKFLKILFLISPVLLLFSIINLFVKGKIFLEWKRFTFIYLFIYLFIVTIFPWYIGDGFFNIQKVHIAILLSIVYSTISLILIIYKTIKLSNRK